MLTLGNFWCAYGMLPGTQLNNTSVIGPIKILHQMDSIFSLKRKMQIFLSALA